MSLDLTPWKEAESVKGLAVTLGAPSERDRHISGSLLGKRLVGKADIIPIGSS